MDDPSNAKPLYKRNRIRSALAASSGSGDLASALRDLQAYSADRAERVYDHGRSDAPAGP